MIQKYFFKIVFFPKQNFIEDDPKNQNVIFLSFQNFENLKFFWKIFKNRKISKCSKMTYFASILFKRAYDRNETTFCRFLTKKNFGKFFEKLWNSTKILKNRKFSNFFFENRPCACCATCAHIRHTNFRASKKVNSAS